MIFSSKGFSFLTFVNISTIATKIMYITLYHLLTSNFEIFLLTMESRKLSKIT